MILREDSQDILDYAKLQKSKLQNMKDQLDILLRKKYRLEIEIKSLKSSIQQRRNTSEKTLKMKLSAESNDPRPISPSEELLLEESYPELYQELKDFDSMTKSIDDYLLEISQEFS